MGVPLVVIIAWPLLRSLTLSLLITGIALFNALLSMALVFVAQREMNAVLTPMPSLVLVLSVSAGVHVVNYFRQVRNQGGRHTAIRTLRRAWLPCSLAAATTAIGQAALTASKTGPVREFGLYSAATITVATPLILFTLPGLLELWGERLGVCPNTTVATEHVLWSKISSAIHRYHAILALIGILAFATCLAGVLQLDTTLTVPTTFSPSTRVVRDAQWLEEHVRPLGQLEVVVDFEASRAASTTRRLVFLQTVARSIAEIPEVERTFSLLDFIPPIPTDAGVRATMRRAVIGRGVDRNIDAILQTNYVTKGGEVDRWRISVYVSLLATTEYSELVDRIESRVSETLALADGPAPLRYECTGLIAVIDQIQSQMLNDLILTYMFSAFAITATMCVVLRSLLGGAMSMLPNVFPAILVLGALGWLGVRLDVGSIMTASVALGIAVDDSLHLLVWFLRGVGSGQSRQNAVFDSLCHCGRAMMQTTGICAIGIHLLGYSYFIPTARFGWFVAAMLVVALLGDLILLPALLVGPIGRICFRQWKKR